MSIQAATFRVATSPIVAQLANGQPVVVPTNDALVALPDGEQAVAPEGTLLRDYRVPFITEYGQGIRSFHNSKLMTAGSGAVIPIIWLGDSHMQGWTGTTGIQPITFFRLMDTYLRGRYGDAGDGYIGHHYCDTTPPGVGTVFTDFPGGSPVAVGGTWGNVLFNLGLSGQIAQPSVGPATLTFTIPGYCNAIDFYQYGNSGNSGTFSMTINGVAVDQTGLAGGGAGANWTPPTDGAYHVTTIHGFTPGAGLVLVISSGANHYTPMGICCYSGNAGVLNARLARFGTSLRVYTFPSSPGIRGSVDQLSFANVVGTGKLVICDHITNAMQEGSGFSYWQDLVRGVFDSADRINAPVLWLLPYCGYETTWTNVGSYSRYAERVYAVARDYGQSVVIDHHQYMATLTQAQRNARFAAAGANFHFNALGHQDIYNLMRGVLY